MEQLHLLELDHVVEGGFGGGVPGNRGTDGRTDGGREGGMKARDKGGREREASGDVCDCELRL